MATTATRHPESEWERHKSEIERLYYDDNRSQKDVAKFMREEHGFHASKYQYESQFQKWGIRKNYSPGFWNSVRHLIRQGGSSSAVKLGGRPVSTRKVKKALARYKPADTDNVAQDLLSLGLEVARSDVSKPQLIRSRLSFAHMTPSISLMNMFMGCNDIGVYRDPHQIQNKFPNAVALFGTGFKKDLTCELPELEIHQTIQQSAKTQPPYISPQAILPLSTLTSTVTASNMTTSSSGQARDITLSQNYSVELHVLIHALSNNMTSQLGFQNLGQVWRYVRKNHSTGTQEVLTYAVQGSYSKDLRHTILQAAIEAGDAAGVSQLIQMWSINVDDVTCYGRNREAFSAVELASGLVHSDVLAVLIDERADINKTGAYSYQKFGKATGGAMYWFVCSAGLPELFHTPLSDDYSRTSFKYAFINSRSWMENTLEVIRHLASTPVCTLALEEALSTARKLVTIFEQTWSLEDLSQLYINTHGTHLFWLFEKSVLTSIDRNSGDHDYIFDVVKWCVPATMTEQAANIWYPPLMDPSALLRKAVHKHSPDACCYLVAEGIELAMPGENCVCASYSNQATLDGCLQKALSAFPTTVPSPLPRVRRRPCKHAGLLTRLCGAIECGLTQEVLHDLEHETKYNSKLIWNALTATTWECSPEYARSGEDKLLLAALAQQNRRLVERLLETRQDPLHIDQSMLTAAWLGRDHELHSLLLGAAPHSHVYPETWDQIFKSPDIALLECLVTHNFEIPSSYRYLQVVCLKGDSRLVQYYLDLTRKRPVDYDESAAELALDMNTFETILNYTPRRGWARHNNFVNVSIISAVGRGDSEHLQRVLDGNIVIDIHSEFWDEMEDDPPPFEGQSLLGLLIVDYKPQNDEAFQLVLQKCCKSSMIDCFAAWDNLESDREQLSSYVGHTPLLLAIRQGLLNLVKILVQRYKANINLPATRGRRRTPLQAAAEHGHYGIVRWLIDNGAAVNAPINQRAGATALQFAALGGFCGIMELLIDGGADLDAPGAAIHGRTALEGAAEHGRMDAVKLLLDSGASITGAGEQSFWRARRRAKDKGYASIVKLLDDSRQRVWSSGPTQVNGILPDGGALSDTEDEVQCGNHCRA